MHIVAQVPVHAVVLGLVRKIEKLCPILCLADIYKVEGERRMGWITMNQGGSDEAFFHEICL